MSDDWKKTGKYVFPKEAPQPDVSIDTVLKDGLINIKRIMDAIGGITVKGSIPDRTVVQSLKDCIQMLSDLKKTEQDLLDDMSEDDIKKILK